MANKIKHGQFYTKGNCFQHDVFRDWYRQIPSNMNKFIEPFAGGNNIIHLIDEANLGITHEQWTSYDIEPEAITKNIVPGVKVLKKDTIKNYPSGFDVCVTNPPYLAKNSAKRKKIEIDLRGHQDLFELSLDIILSKTKYVAAIIPESFISRGIFTDRLVSVISLNYNMFDDTDFPVCLALFNPEKTPSFNIYLGDKLIGDYLTIKSKTDKIFSKRNSYTIKFNDPKGQLGLKAVDSTSGASIEFIEGKFIPSRDIKISSRAITRIKLQRELTKQELTLLINESNKILDKYRKINQDVFITSFKGLRKDSKYRRRLDFATAKQIIEQAITNIKLFG